MNVPEYRRALAEAMQQHADAIGKAKAVLDETVGSINDAFFSDHAETREARRYDDDR